MTRPDGSDGNIWQGMFWGALLSVPFWAVVIYLIWKRV